MKKRNILLFLIVSFALLGLISCDKEEIKPEDNPPIVEVTKYNVTFNTDGDTSIKSIGGYAFDGCSNFANITILDGVTSIGRGAFYNYSQFKELYYKGTSTDWENICIRLDNLSLVLAIRYYYSETGPTTTSNYWHYVDGFPTKWELSK